MMSLKILSRGSGLALQDSGRAGWLRYGVPRGGAMDRHAMSAANQLLGNSPYAPVLEVFLQGARLKVLEDTWVAVTGADFCPRVPAWTACQVKAGEEIEFSAKGNGLFAYLAVPGGFSSDAWFGSVSADPRIGLGGVLKKGTPLRPKDKHPKASVEGVARRLLIPEVRRDYTPEATFHILPGPQFEAFSEQAREALVEGSWTVSAQSDRTGYRIDGLALEVPESIQSEPVLPGSFQIPGNGQPIITMNDGPTVGGYPKIAVLRDADRDRLAQCAPGTQLSFQWDKS